MMFEPGGSWSFTGLFLKACSFSGITAEVVKQGAEPKKKREGSAKPYLVVQFHPAPPFPEFNDYRRDRRQVRGPHMSVSLAKIFP